MKFHADQLRLYAVTDRSHLGTRSLAEVVQEVVSCGATFVQLREKHASYDDFLQTAREIQHICAQAQVPFVINDNLEIAREIGADGVHVGQSDASCRRAREVLGPHAIVGVSVQTVEQARLAEAAGADYVGVGALIPTPTKPDAVDVTRDELVAICKAISIPAVGIGGLTAQTIPSFAKTGLVGAAVVSALFSAEDPACAARQLKDVCDAAFGCV